MTDAKSSRRLGGFRQPRPPPATHTGGANTQDSWSLLGVDGAGAVTPLGTVGAPIIGGSLSRDLTRATFMQMDYRADAWLNQVVVR